MLYQQHHDPFVAIVIDPTRTCAAGKVEIGAFRTYPANQIPLEEEKSDYHPVPVDRIEDFGLHWRQYYSLTIDIFKSSLDTKLLDQLWSQYWVETLSSSPLLSNSEFLNSVQKDVAVKLEQLNSNQNPGGWSTRRHKPCTAQSTQLKKVAKDSSRGASELVDALSNQALKDKIFNKKPILDNFNFI
eukprot:GHVL01023999.1.p1 GENE.GHVL01023999.1~~GHVL01023999.1.p1  ORF type:complete len:186 (+),score=29.71 GHVL01023999.1:548-1105(+)